MQSQKRYLQNSKSRTYVKKRAAGLSVVCEEFLTVLSLCKITEKSIFTECRTRQKGLVQLNIPPNMPPPAQSASTVNVCIVDRSPGVFITMDRINRMIK